MFLIHQIASSDVLPNESSKKLIIENRNRCKLIQINFMKENCEENRVTQSVDYSDFMEASHLMENKNFTGDQIKDDDNHIISGCVSSNSGVSSILSLSKTTDKQNLHKETEEQSEQLRASATTRFHYESSMIGQAHPLYGHGICKWPGCEKLFDDSFSFTK